MDQQQETRLMVVRNWMTPAVTVYERVSAPIRVLCVAIAAATVRYAIRIRDFAVRMAVAMRGAWHSFVRRLARRIALVAHDEYVHLTTSIAQLEAQSLIIAAHLERRERRIKAYVGLARTLLGLGRSPHTALAHAYSILEDQKYWTRKAGRIDSAMHYACAVAEIAYHGGDSKLAYDAYTIAVQYGDRLDGHFRRIRFAIMMADVAGHVLPLDKPTWLAQALSMAILIEDEKERARSVSAVATKMVEDGFAPPAEDVHVELLCRCAEYGDYTLPEDVLAEVPDEDSIDEFVGDAFDEHNVA